MSRNKVNVGLAEENCGLKKLNALLVQQIIELREENDFLRAKLEEDENSPDILEHAIQRCNPDLILTVSGEPLEKGMVFKLVEEALNAGEE